MCAWSQHSDQETLPVTSNQIIIAIIGFSRSVSAHFTSFHLPLAVPRNPSKGQGIRASPRRSPLLTQFEYKIASAPSDIKTYLCKLHYFHPSFGNPLCPPSAVAAAAAAAASHLPCTRSYLHQLNTHHPLYDPLQKLQIRPSLAYISTIEYLHSTSSRPRQHPFSQSATHISHETFASRPTRKGLGLSKQPQILKNS